MRLTLCWSDAGHRQRAPDVDEAAAVRHLVLSRILAEVIVIHRVNETQVEQQPVQNLNTAPGQNLNTAPVQNLNSIRT